MHSKLLGFDTHYMRSKKRNRESGQAAVESAIIIPLQVFLLLGLLQLILMQHAKIFTEYAAYQAARAGIVWNGNNERMHDAAITALVPTMGNTSDVKNWALTLGKAQVYDTALSALAFKGLKPFNGANLIGQVRIDTINPSWWSPINSIWKLKAATWEELDFDGPDDYPEDPKLVQFIKGLLDPNYEDNQEENYRKSTVLSIRLRYFYELRVPFANWLIFYSWLAANAGLSARGAIWAPTLDPTANALTVKTGTPTMPPGKGIDHQKGYNTLYTLEIPVLWGLATGSIPLVSSIVGKHYFIPLSATYSMRMQSNFNRRWLMHINPNWDL